MKKLTIAVSLACLLVISNAKANTYDGKYCLNKDGQKEGMDKTSQKTWKGNNLVDYLRVKTNGFEASAKTINYKQEYQVEKKVQENEWKARGKPIKETMISYAKRANVSGKNPSGLKEAYNINKDTAKSTRASYYDKIVARGYNNNFVMIEKRNPNASNVKMGRLNQNNLSASSWNGTSLNFNGEKSEVKECPKEKLVSKNTFTFSKENNKG